MAVDIMLCAQCLKTSVFTFYCLLIVVNVPFMLMHFWLLEKQYCRPGGK